MSNGQEQLDIHSIRLKLRNQRENRRRYFNMLKDASGSAALNLLNERVNLLEDETDDSGLTVSEYFFDVLVSLALGPVSGAILSKITNTAIDKILGSRGELLFVRNPKGELQYTILKNKQGDLVKYNSGSQRPARLFRNRIKEFNKIRTKERTVLLWKGSANAISDSVLEVASDEARDAFDLNSTKSLLSNDSNPIRIKVAVDNAAEAQKSFETKFINYVLSAVDDRSSTKRFIASLYQSIAPLDYTESEWRSMYHRYLSHFEACMWAVHIGDINNKLVWVLKDDRLDRYQRRQGEWGNSLFPREMPIAYGSNVRIKRGKLVRYLLKNLIHPKSREGLTIWDYFLQTKFKTRRGRGNAPEGTTWETVRANYDIEKKKELYRELIYHHLHPYLTNVLRQANNILGPT